MVVPMAVHKELIRRRYFEGEAEIREAVVPAAKYIAAVVRGEEEPDLGRLKACETVLERFFGKPRQYVDLGVTELEAPWQKALKLAIVGTDEQLPVGRDDDIEDADIVDPIDPEDSVVDPWPDEWEVIEPDDIDETSPTASPTATGRHEARLPAGPYDARWDKYHRNQRRKQREAR